MKNKYLSMFLSGICSLNLLNTGASALLSNSHYYISEQVLDKFQEVNNIKLDDESKEYFKSGSVMADIGRFDMDKAQIQNKDTNYTIESDSEEFTGKLLEVAKENNNKNDIWYALGSCIHCVQDQHTGELLDSLKNFDNSKELSNSKKYYFKCGIVDNYFYNKLKRAITCENLSENFDLAQTGKGLLTDEELENYKQYAPLFFIIYFLCAKPNNLLLNEDLLVKTYKEIGLDVTAENIRKQAANLVGSSAVLSYISTEFIKEEGKSSEEIKENQSEELHLDTPHAELEKSINNLVDKCVAKLQDLTKNIDFKNLN